MKRLIIVVALLLIPAYASADLTADEINILTRVFQNNYDRGGDDIEAAQKVDAVLNGTEEQKKVLVKEAIEIKYLPKWKRTEAEYQRLLADIQTKISRAEEYIKAK